MHKIIKVLFILLPVLSLNALAAEETMIACNKSSKELTIYTEQADNCVNGSAKRFKMRNGTIEKLAKDVVSSCAYAINNLTDITHNQYLCEHGESLNYGRKPRYTHKEVKKQIENYYQNKAQRLLRYD